MIRAVRASDRSLALFLCSSAAIFAVLLLGGDHARGSVLAEKWKPYEEPKNVFDDFDSDFKQGAWQEYKAPSNVFDQLAGLQDADHKWEANVLNDENVFDSMPDRYPFDETKGGHKWKVWEGETTSEAIKEPNVFDHGTGLHAINLGEHGKERQEEETGQIRTGQK
eukprot:295719-Hanusia_phi.AAC.1